jgi:methylamine--corrinoid protein Co-methyltransferase
MGRFNQAIPDRIFEYKRKDDKARIMKNTDIYEYMLLVLDKAENGLVVEEKEWDLNYIHRSIKELVKKYDIHWEAGLMVPSDDSLADRLFSAGMELAREVGLYCLDTKRQMKWSQDELDYILSTAPGEETIGTGQDSVTIRHRLPDERSPITTIGGPYGTPVPEELFVPIMISYAQERVLDYIDNATLTTTHGRSIKAGSPWEAVGCWQEAQLSLEVLERVGRPGMPIGCAEDSPSAIGELATTTYGGFRLTDWHHASLISELKVAYAELTKAIHYQHTGASSHNFYNSIYGGYVGGSEGLAVAIVAGVLLMKATFNGSTQNPGPSHAHLSCNTFPAMIPSLSLGFQALSRNTRLLTTSFPRPVAGPCTKELLYEAAAMAVATVPAGISVLEGIQSAAGRIEGHVTGLEAKFLAQVGHACEGLTRKEADPMVRKLVPLYAEKQQLGVAMSGKHFTEAYDVETIRPTRAWQAMYEEVCSEVETLLGITLSE